MDLVFDKTPKRLFFDNLNMDNRKISVNVIGAGGTGSYVLSNLARINKVLLLLGRPGLFVKAFDTDVVSQYNVGRSLFSEADIGENKAKILIQRINRFFGYEWDYDISDRYDCNILISCVDSIKSRKKIDEHWKQNREVYIDHQINHVWIDAGNMEYHGQVIYTTEKTPTIIDLLTSSGNELLEDNKPSCSMREALFSQSMNINMAIGMMVSKLIEETFDMGINYNFLEFNIKSFTANKQNLSYG